MKPIHSLRHGLATISLLATFFVPQQFLQAQTTWSGAGTDDLWSTLANWGGITPTDGSVLVFDGATRLINTNDLALNGIAGIQFNSGGFVLNGNSFSLSSSAITNSVGTNVVGMGLTWGLAGNLYAAPDTELIISGVLSNPHTSGSNVVYKGGGRIRITGAYNQPNNPPAQIINNAEVVLDGGTFTNAGGFRIASDPSPASSKMILTNGAIMSQIVQAGAMRIGDSNAVTGTFIMDNSSLFLVSNSINIPFNNGAIGSFVQRGGTNSGGVINFIRGSTSGTGSYEMIGGLLATYQIRKDNAVGTATMSFDGSIVRALAAGPTAFFTGLNTAEIKSGGLTLDSNGEAFTVGQVFSGVGRLTKIGNGTVTVNGASAHSGGITVNGGTVVLSSVGFTGGLILSSGTLQMATNLPVGIGTLSLNGGSIRGNNATSRTNSQPVTLGGNVTYASTSDLLFTGAHTLTGNRTLTVNNTNTISGTIGESGGACSITKAGTGILIISAVDNNYSGGTVVNNGTLRVTNPTGSATGSGAVIVTNTGVLSGNGQVAAISLISGGKVAPGTSVGTLTVTNAATFNTGGVYQLEMTDANPALAVGVGRDFLNIQGALDIVATSATPFVIDLSSAGGPAANFDSAQTNSWIIATAASGITGFASDKFVVSTNNFQNELGTNVFSVAASGNNLLLTFGAAPTPKPTIDSNIVGAGTTNAQISFSSVSGASYTVQYKTNLNQVGWLNLTNFNATGSTSTAVDNTSPVPAERYYRVISP